MAGDVVGALRVENVRGMRWWRVEMERSGVGGDFDPKAKYQMHCIRYWPVMSADGGWLGGSA